MVEAKKKTKKVEKQTASVISPEVKAELLKSNIVTRGRIFTGTVIGTKASKTVRIEWPRRYFLPKYERYEKRRTRIQAHKPDTLQIEVGDKVRISECRPISKTKKFVVIEKLEVKN